MTPHVRPIDVRLVCSSVWENAHAPIGELVYSKRRTSRSLALRGITLNFSAGAQLGRGRPPPPEFQTLAIEHVF